MTRELSVMVAGVPTAAVPAQEWRARAHFNIRGREPKLKKWEMMQTFREGCTKWIRKPVIRNLQDSAQLSDMNVVANVVDAGEFLFGLPKDSTGLPEEEMLGLANDFFEQSKEFDAVILLGGDHSGGLLLYGLPGMVARYDQHSDSCTEPTKCGDGLIKRNDYVCAAIRNGLKTPSEIIGVGVRSGQSPYPIAPFASSCPIMDVDVDVLSLSWGIKSDYDKGTLSPSDLVGAIRRNRPTALGIFETVEGDSKAVELASTLSIETVAAFARGKSKRGARE
jgi:hypothetical protein